MGKIPKAVSLLAVLAACVDYADRTSATLDPEYAGARRLLRLL